MTTFAAAQETPAAHQILDPDVDRDTWLAARRLGVCGSDTPVLFGDTKYDQSLYGLWLDKTGHALPEPESDVMRRGNWLEAHLADWFAEETGLAVERCGMLVSNDRDHLRTNVDRLTADGGVLEIKTHGVYTDVAKEWRNGGISRSAYLQGQQQLAVTGLDHVWFTVFIDPTPHLRGPVPRDERLIAQILDRADTFWLDHVLPKVPPAVDLATITDAELELRWPTAVEGTAVEAEYPNLVQQLLDERAELKAAAKSTKTRLDEVESALKVFIGDAEVLTVDGQPVMTYRNVARAAYSVPASTGRRIHIPSRKTKN